MNWCRQSWAIKKFPADQPRAPHSIHCLVNVQQCVGKRLTVERGRRSRWISGRWRPNELRHVVRRLSPGPLPWHDESRTSRWRWRDISRHCTVLADKLLPLFQFLPLELFHVLLDRPSGLEVAWSCTGTRSFQARHGMSSISMRDAHPQAPSALWLLMLLDLVEIQLCYLIGPIPCTVSLLKPRFDLVGKGLPVHHLLSYCPACSCLSLSSQAKDRTWSPDPAPRERFV